MGGSTMVESCVTPSKMQTYKVLELPDKLVPNSMYIVESDPTNNLVDMYITDRSGKIKIVIDNTRVPTQTPTESLISYEVDTESLTTYYYYGYEYPTRWKVIRISKSDITNKNKAEEVATSFAANWINREILTYT